MKKILLLLTAIILMNSYNTKIFAQENTTEEIDTIVVTQEENTEEEKEETTLSEKLNTQGETTNKPLSFVTILFATLTPILFLVICYMLIKLFKE